MSLFGRYRHETAMVAVKKTAAAMAAVKYALFKMLLLLLRKAEFCHIYSIAHRAPADKLAKIGLFLQRRINVLLQWLLQKKVFGPQFTVNSRLQRR